LVFHFHWGPSSFVWFLSFCGE